MLIRSILRWKNCTSASPHENRTNEHSSKTCFTTWSPPRTPAIHWPAPSQLLGASSPKDPSLTLAASSSSTSTLVATLPNLSSPHHLAASPTQQELPLETPSYTGGLSYYKNARTVDLPHQTSSPSRTRHTMLTPQLERTPVIQWWTLPPTKLPKNLLYIYMAPHPTWAPLKIPRHSHPLMVFPSSQILPPYTPLPPPPNMSPVKNSSHTKISSCTNKPPLRRRHILATTSFHEHPTTQYKLP